MALVQFHTLWENHPYPDTPCNNEYFFNHCAIRMGVALEKSGVDTSSFDIMYPDRRCYPSLKHKPGHILAAQELANWLKSNKLVFGNVEIYKKVTSNDFKGRQGIVFIRDGWSSTDHIDLWNGMAMKGGYPDYFALGKEVWFWEIKI